MLDLKYNKPKLFTIPRAGSYLYFGVLVTMVSEYSWKATGIVLKYTKPH